MLKGAAVNAGDVTVAIVPFTFGVNVGTANKAASWLTYAPWDLAGSGYGSYQNRYGQNCTKGSYGCNWVATDSDHSTWSGASWTATRTMTSKTPCDDGTTATLFPAAPGGCTASRALRHECGLSTKLIGETDVLNSTGWTNLNNTVTNMTAPARPIRRSALPGDGCDDSRISHRRSRHASANTQQIIILLSDGLNTVDRWTGNGSAMTPARMRAWLRSAARQGGRHHDLYGLRRSQRRAGQFRRAAKLRLGCRQIFRPDVGGAIVTPSTRSASRSPICAWRSSRNPRRCICRL